MIPNVSDPRRHWLIVAGLAVLVVVLGYWRLVPEVCGALAHHPSPSQPWSPENEAWPPSVEVNR